MARVLSRTDLRAGVDDVFNFVSEPRNIPSVYPEDLNFRVVSGPAKMESGG